MNIRTAHLLPVFFLAACGSLETARMVDLGDVPRERSLWRPAGTYPEPVFVDTSRWLKREVNVALSVQPDLETFVRGALEEELGTAPERVRVDGVGYRYAYYFPSRRDDFFLRAEVRCEALGIDGEFEGVVRGIDLMRPWELFGDDWPEEIPYTGPPGAEDEDTIESRLHRWADGRATLNRHALRRATEHLVRAVGAARHRSRR